MKNSPSPTKLDLSSCMSYYFHWSILFLKLNEVFGYRSFLLGIAIDGFRYVRLLIIEILEGGFFAGEEYLPSERTVQIRQKRG